MTPLEHQHASQDAFIAWVKTNEPGAIIKLLIGAYLVFALTFAGLPGLMFAGRETGVVVEAVVGISWPALTSLGVIATAHGLNNK